VKRTRRVGGDRRLERIERSAKFSILEKRTPKAIGGVIESHVVPHEGDIPAWLELVRSGIGEETREALLAVRSMDFRSQRPRPYDRNDGFIVAVESLFRRRTGPRKFEVRRPSCFAKRPRRTLGELLLAIL
jgi:hypothetical protein